LATKTKRRARPHPFEVKTENVATEKIEGEISPELPETKPMATLTVETLLYALILVIGLGFRLWNLGAYPLSAAEAEQSLVAWTLYFGGQPEAELYSPLLLTLNTLTFFLFGASDATARLATVLLGSSLILLPALFRNQLGPLVSLLTSLLLAISPAAVFLSRTINSEIGVAVGALMLLAGFFNWTETGRQRWLWLMAGGLAIMLTAGPMAYSVLVVFGIILFIRLPAFKARVSHGLQLSTATKRGVTVKEAGEQSERQGEAELQPEGEETSHFGLRRAGIFLLVTLLLLATTFTFNLSGFGMVAGFVTDWLGRFGLQTRPEAGFNAVFLLTIYEPLVVAAGLTGLALVLLRQDLLGTTLGGWFVGLLVLDLIMGGRPNGSVILLLVPLAFLAAIALTGLGEGIRHRGSWGNEGIMLAAGLVIAVFAYIGLTGWLTRACGPDDTLCQYGWLQPVAALALFLMIVFFFGFINDASTAGRGAALAAVAVGLLATISIGWRLNYGPLMHLGYQPLAGIPASTELVQLTNTLTDQSESRVGDARLLDVTLAGITNPALRWQLREFDHLNQANSPQGGAPATAIITPPSYEGGLDLSQAYLGQDLALDAVWSPVGLPAKEFFKWLIYRQVDERPEGNRVVLWLRLD
jgi:uncharacterized protein (TIGR03663 family)